MSVLSLTQIYLVLMKSKEPTVEAVWYRFLTARCTIVQESLPDLMNTEPRYCLVCVIMLFINVLMYVPGARQWAVQGVLHEPPGL